jgi:hypothetical protein
MPQLGNFGGSYTVNMQTGSGTNRQRTPFGHVMVTGDIGDVVYIPTTALYPRIDVPGQGINAQAIGTCAATISVTLAPSDLAENPAQNNVWVTPTVVASGSIVTLPKIGTTLKVAFTAHGVLYLMGC